MHCRYLVFGVLRPEADVDQGWLPRTWGLDHSVAESDSLYVVGVYIVALQLIFRLGLLVALHNPAHGQWCREFCSCIVNFEVGRKYRERFMVEDDWEADFTNSCVTSPTVCTLRRTNHR